MRLNLLLATVVLAGCSAAPADILPVSDAGKGGADAVTSMSPEGGSPPPYLAQTARVIVVNDAPQLGDVRACVDGMEYPMPDDPAHPMPLANYTGVAVGRGLDLGVVNESATTVTFYSAVVAAGNQPGAAPNVRRKCDEMLQPVLATASVVIQKGANLLIVRDAQPGVSVSHAVLAPKFTGDADHIQAQVVLAPNVADGTAKYSSGASPTWQDSLKAMTPSVVGMWSIPVAFDSATLNVSKGTFSFSQSLAAIQYVSDPTSAPSTYYGRRLSFAFVLVGDVMKPYDDAKDHVPSYDGVGLHFVAVTYADP